MLSPNTMTALEGLTKAGVLAPDAAADLTGALRLWHNVQQMLKLTTLDQEIDESEAPPSLLSLMAGAAGAVDFAALKRDMDDKAARAVARYRDIAGRGD